MAIQSFFSAIIEAGAISGLLAYGIAQMDGIGGYSGWRWIFIIEGLLTVFTGIAAKFLSVDWPETFTLLHEEERALPVKRTFSDIRTYLGAVMYFGIVNTGYATSFFTPTILRQLDWTSVRVQVMSIPIYMVATVIALATAFTSDRLHRRFTFTLVGGVIATIGYIILICRESVPVGARYFALFAITGGGYMAQLILLGWVNNNMAGHYKQSIAFAMQIGFGNCGGLVVSNVFSDSEAPPDNTGFGVSLGMILIGVVTCIVLVMYIVKIGCARQEVSSVPLA
ncbi:unnamed protein product [Penicillium glandicola]